MRGKEREIKERQMRRVKKMKGNKGLKAKPPTSTLANDVLIRDEEQKKEKNREWEPNPATLEHSDDSYNPHGLSSGVIQNLKPPVPYRVYIYIIYYI